MKTTYALQRSQPSQLLLGKLHVMSYLRIALLNVVTHGEFLTSVPALTITYSDVYRILLKRSIVVLKRIFNYYSYQVFSITKDVNFFAEHFKTG